MRVNINAYKKAYPLNRRVTYGYEVPKLPEQGDRMMSLEKGQEFNGVFRNVTWNWSMGRELSIFLNVEEE